MPKNKFLVQVVLHSLLVEDYLQKWGPKFRNLIASDLSASSDPLLNFAYRKIEPQSPEYSG